MKTVFVGTLIKLKVPFWFLHAFLLFCLDFDYSFDFFLDKVLMLKYLIKSELNKAKETLEKRLLHFFSGVISQIKFIFLTLLPKLIYFLSFTNFVKTVPKIFDPNASNFYKFSNYEIRSRKLVGLNNCKKNMRKIWRVENKSLPNGKWSY